MLVFYRRAHGCAHPMEECHCVELERALSPQEFDQLLWLAGHPIDEIKMAAMIADPLGVVEIGPRLSVETPASSNRVAVCRSMGLPVVRYEVSTRYKAGPGLMISGEMSPTEIIQSFLDPMTQEVYSATLTSFGEGHSPEPVSFVDVQSHGKSAMRDANKTLGLGMDAWDEKHWTKFFARLGRNPTDVELFQIGNGNSEHSRHWFFRGIQVVDGVEMPESLMDIVREPLRRNIGRSLVAFHDNAGVMRGGIVDMFAPSAPGWPSAYVKTAVRQHLTATAETHNHPTLIAPFPGAETGAGGRIRDNRAVGRGGLVHAGLAGYCVGNLHLSGYAIPGESVGGEVSRRSASPLDILIQGSNGVSDYGNKIGEPLIGGFCRSFGQMVDGQRREFRKPVLYSAGVGRLLDQHVKKHSPQQGMLIVRVGGPAYRIGVGGGSASSMIHGAQDEGLDFKSVQRGNAEMENRVNRVIQACAELMDRNPIESIHDQGAGGPSNVLTELMEPMGGKVDIRKITLGDKTMSVLEMWVAEFQEGYGLLLRPNNLEMFESICKRERVNCEVLGEITGDGNVIVLDSVDNTTPVNLSLKDILGELPRKRFESKRPKQALQPLVIPKGLTVEEALKMVFKLPQVGSKGYLVHKVDRSVTGLVARQQCCGPTQVPVANAAVTADGYFGLTGAATALGEQPIKMLIDPKAGARMAVSEMLTNMASVRISKLSDVRCRANWMWAAKRQGEGALLYDAAVAMRDIMLKLGLAIDGGKDSLSMATQVGETLVVSPGELVVMGYAPVPDVTKVVAPDFKSGEAHHLSRIDLGQGRNRIGGSALAQTLGQLGNEPPDIDDPDLLRRAFEAVQELIENDLITAYHDISDGGLITAIAEMCIAGNCGASIIHDNGDILASLFSEEAGMVFAYLDRDVAEVADILRAHDVPYKDFGVTSADIAGFMVWVGGYPAFAASVSQLREWWEATSDQLELKQMSRETAEALVCNRTLMPEHRLTFEPKAPNLLHYSEFKVAVVREEGTNGEREMAAAFRTAGLNPYDIAMSDLLDGRVTSLEQFRGLVFPGGFSYADVFGSAKGWAGPLRFNSRLREMFDRFYERPNTFSLGVCNGCQLMANIGWLPYKGIDEVSQPRLMHNKSGRFESRWVAVRITQSPSILLRGMGGSVLGINVAHGEGRFYFPDKKISDLIIREELDALEYVDPSGDATMVYPYNPNGSPLGIAGICSPDGRHLAMMPHPERSFLKWQWPWMPERFRNLEASPWLRMFQNARTWCLEH